MTPYIYTFIVSLGFFGPSSDLEPTGQFYNSHGYAYEIHQTSMAPDVPTTITCYLDATERGLCAQEANPFFTGELHTDI